jgi:alkylation response protein AidB-like acyl-CoA dehydrogenase
MDLAPSPEQRQLVESFQALYAREAPSGRVHAADELGFDRSLWAALVGNGVLDMALPESVGGWGAGRVDLALVAEVHGAHVAPAPLAEAQAAVALLAVAGGIGLDLIGRTRAEGLVLSLSVRPAVEGWARLVPYAAVADAVLVLEDDRLLWIDRPGAVPAVTTGQLALGDVRIGPDAVVLLRGPAAVGAYERAVDLWMVLTAAALIGTAAAALDAGTAYAKERRAFDRQIGSFQAVAHRLADIATHLEGARLLLYRTAWAADGEPARSPELSPLALATAAETAREATGWCLHFHGGYGFMNEHDAQLYWRRARTLPALLGTADQLFALSAGRRVA